MMGMWRHKGRLNEKGQYDYTPVDPDLKPVIHKSSPREHFKYGDFGGPEEHVPDDFARGQSKGKVFLVNETYVRVDGSDYINIKANVGRYQMIEVNTGRGMSQLVTPKCEGYVFRPLPREIQNWTMAEPLSPRCMTGQELREAAQDHVFLRNVRHFQTSRPPTLWVEYYHSTGDWGDSYARHKLLAFNRALHKKRVELNLKRHEDGVTYNYEDLISSTFDEKKHTLKGVPI